MKGQLPRTASLGAAYIQGAAPGGPVARALEEVRGLGRTGAQTNKENKCSRQSKREVRSSFHQPQGLNSITSPPSSPLPLSSLLSLLC